MEKIQFVICATDQMEIEEAVFYLNRLQVPKEIEVVKTIIWDAQSMAEGYNRAQNMVDAKYRVFMHQDTMILNPNFILDIMAIFQSDSSIGMLGMVGCKKMPENALFYRSWDSGKVETNQIPFELNYQSDELKEKWEQVVAVDGLLIVTQQDLPWRKDLFQKWDFYDISQAMECRRKGLKVVVPWQEKPWCWHDNDTSKLSNYETECNLFQKEYQDIFPFQQVEVTFNAELEQVLVVFEQEIGSMIDAGKIEEVSVLLEQYHAMIASHAKLVLLETVCMIRKVEKAAGKMEHLYGEGLDTKALLEQFCKDKYLIKRLDHGIPDTEKLIQSKMVAGTISKEAVQVFCACYLRRKDKIKNLFEE